MALEQAVAVIAVDPGSSKCGIAAVRRGDPGDAVRAIVETAAAPSAIAGYLDAHPGAALIVGRGTGSAALVSRLREVPGCPAITLVDERGTSIEARRRYLLANPPRGWRRLIPPALRYPDAPYDDYAALIMAERWLQGLPGAAPAP